MKICDANVVLRYILDDNPELSEKATALIENDNVFLPFEVIAEIVYVLQKVYGVDRQKVSENISEIIRFPNILTVDEKAAAYALTLFSESGLDFVDTLLCGYRHSQGREIVTFDRKLSNQLNRIESES